MKSFSLLRLLLIAIVIVCAASVFFLWPHEKNTDSATVTIPSGTLYLSLADKAPSEAEPQGWTSSYAWSPENDSLSPFIKDDTHHYLDTTFSPDGRRVATVEVSSPFSTRTPAKIVVMDPDGTNRSEYAVSTETPVRMPSWSPDGKTIAYAQLSSPDLDITIPSNWRIHEIDLVTGADQIITNGLNPLFAPNGDVLVLKDDGLYRMGNTQELLWGLNGGTIQSHMRLSLSKDGSLLAWAVPQSRGVMILNVESWEPFKAKTIAVIPTLSYSAMFSPDGKYLALQKEMGEDSQPTSHITVYETTQYTPIYDFDLNAFAPWETAITDWR